MYAYGESIASSRHHLCMYGDAWDAAGRVPASAVKTAHRGRTRARQVTYVDTLTPRCVFVTRHSKFRA